MQVKKQYEEIFAIMQAALEAKPKCQLSTLMPDLLAVMQSKGSGSDIGKTFLKDEEGRTYAVYCYYHKRWELVDHIEYGKKANTATGLNTMCKDGVSKWSKQQRQYNKAKDALLMQVADGTLPGDKVPGMLEELETARKEIISHDFGDEWSFETVEELQDFMSTYTAE